VPCPRRSASFQVTVDGFAYDVADLTVLSLG
jgi:hypothetical protein